MSISRLTTAVLSYTAALKAYVQSRLGATVVAEAVTIPASSSIDYDLTTLLGASHEGYDKLSAVIRDRSRRRSPAPFFGTTERH